jgi:non-ribosomal peptide synthetase component E (peptide arylation enzyme)
MILASQESIDKFTRLGVWSEKTLIDYFKEHVKKDPDKICVVDPYNKEDLTGTKPERLTYKEFDRAVDSTAEALVDLGIGKDDIVMVQLPNSWELAMLYLAIARTGALTTPAPILWRKAELSHIARTTEAKALITINEFNKFSHLDLAQSLQTEFPSLEHILTLEDIRKMSKGTVSGKLDKIHVDANDIFTICWTSGTEANPKGCPLSHNNWKGMAAAQEPGGMQPGDVYLTAGPLVNMASVGTVYVPWLMLGGAMVIHHPFNPIVFIEQMVQEKVNYTLLVPAVTNMIAKHPKVDTFDLSAVRAITVGSAPSSLWTVQEFKRRWDIDIGNIWGQNEGTGIVSGIVDVPDMEKRLDHFPQFGKSGVQWKSRSADFIEAKVIDPEGTELIKPGDVGELVYKGPGVMAEYFRNPEATKKSFTQDGFFMTGDLFMIKEDGFISFFDRGKDIIIRGGFNISAQEIENYLFSHPKVQDAAVVSIPDERLGEKMCAYIVPNPGKNVVLADLTELLEEKGVAKYKWPERIEITDAIPRNPVGKIVKSTLRKDIREKMGI